MPKPTAAPGKPNWLPRAPQGIAQGLAWALGMLTSVILAVLGGIAVIGLLSMPGCGTVPSASACPTPSAPGHLLAPVPRPIPLPSPAQPSPSASPSKTSPTTARHVTT